MTAVRVLPRDWDAGRLLRFLAGLALLALAFSAHAGLTAEAVAAPPAVSVTTTVDGTTGVDVTTSVDVTTDVDVPAAEAPGAPVIQPALGVPMIENGPVPVVSAVVAEPAGVAPGAHGSRGPPAV